MKVVPKNYEAIKDFLLSYKAKSYVPITCYGCGAKTEKPKFRIQAAIKHGWNLYCSSTCFGKNTTTEVTLPCGTCGNQVTRNAAEASSSKSGYIFCNSSCAAKYNNTYIKKRQPGVHYINGKAVPATSDYRGIKSKYCVCGSLIRKNINLCKDCTSERRKTQADQNYLSTTFGQVKEKYPGKSHTYYIWIRKGARRLAQRRNMKKVCLHCGYNTYVELCHLRPISGFPDEATMAEINSEENLAYLCPNHHKEQEMGLLDI